MKEATLKKIIAEKVRIKKPAAHYRLFLFGSRAGGGKTHERSDYDVGIDSGFGIHRGLLGEIREALDEIPVLQKIDLVDFSQVSPEFKKNALQRIEILYEQ